MTSFIDHDAILRTRLPSGLRIRRGTEQDELATFDVMRRSMGYDINWTHHVSARRHLRASPDSSYWLAEETPRFGKSRIVGYAHSVVREGIWHLTEFFVLPTHHRQGIGNALLEQCLRDGETVGAHTRFVLASHHPGANALYIRKAGCFPRLPMFLLTGPPLALHPAGTRNAPIRDTVTPELSSCFYGFAAKDPEEPGSTLLAEPLILSPEVESALDLLDRESIGFARPPEHRHWEAERGGLQGASRLFRLAEGPDAGRIVGYAYYSRTSSGPAVALESADLPRMLTHVVGVSQSIERIGGGELCEAVEPYWAVPGINETALRWLLLCGWQIVFQYYLMSSRPLGQMERYICHNPLHFL